MLRSLTRRLKIESEQHIGIAFSRSKVCVTSVDRSAGHPKVLWTKLTEIETPMFTPIMDGSGGSSLYRTLMPLVDELKDDAYPVSVVLPDHSVRAVTFELDEMPKSKSTLASLASWRMSKELDRPEEELECQLSVLGEARGKHLLYVQAGDRQWIDQIRSTLSMCEILPWEMNSAAFYRFNHLNDNAITPSSALLSIDDDCWTLQMWDENNRIRFTVTRLRNQSHDHGEIVSISNEITRVMRAWYMTQPDLKVKILYLAGCKADIEAVTCIIQPQLFGEFRTIDKFNDNNDAVNGASLKSLATMAAYAE